MKILDIQLSGDPHRENFEYVVVNIRAVVSRDTALALATSFVHNAGNVNLASEVGLPQERPTEPATDKSSEPATTVVDQASASQTEGSAAPASTAPAVSTGRRKASTAAPQDATQAAPNSASETPTVAPATSRRRVPLSGAASAGATETPAPETSSSGTQATAVAPTTTEGVALRRRLPLGSANTGTTTNATASAAAAATCCSEITDQDLAKAASAAAEVITPAEVQAVIATFNVANMQKMTQDQRHQFLKTLKEKSEAAS